jgi:cyclophilin family peptidyl-prolyl cis-trans isomerase
MQRRTLGKPPLFCMESLAQHRQGWQPRMWGSCAGKYTIFAHVIDGMDVLDKMEKVPVGAADRPVNDIKLDRITIHANPLAS